MSSSRRRTAPRCANEDCGSRRFHLGGDGFTYCDQGHQQSQLGAYVENDTGELIVQGQSSRRQQPLDAESVSSKVSVFQGPTAFEHYLLCLQFILRKQVRWLLDVQKAPRELENLVKDLWALRLQKVQARVTYDADSDTDGRSSQRFSSQSERGSDSEALSSRRTRSRSRYSSRSAGPERNSPNVLNLTDLLSLIRLSFLILRIPVTTADMCDWIESGELLYYHAARAVPLAMRARLPATLQQQLDGPSQLHRPAHFHKNLLALVNTFHSDFGMLMPPVNYALVLHRWVQLLAIPLEAQVAALRLARMLRVDFHYVSASSDAIVLPNKSLRFPEVRLMTVLIVATKLLFPFDKIRRVPESSNHFAALKMDWERWQDIQKDSSISDEGNANSRNDAKLSFVEAYNMTENDALALHGDRLDDYIEWCATHLASEELRDRTQAQRDDAVFRTALFETFPMRDKTFATASAGHVLRPSENRPADLGERDRTGEGAAEPPAMAPQSSLEQIQATLQPEKIVNATTTAQHKTGRGGRRIRSDDNNGSHSEHNTVPRPGSSYISHKTSRELEGPLRTLYQIAAPLAGCTLDELVAAVFKVEMLMIKADKAMSK